jgi:hypothetical protein
MIRNNPTRSAVSRCYRNHRKYIFGSRPGFYSRFHHIVGEVPPSALADGARPAAWKCACRLLRNLRRRARYVELGAEVYIRIALSPSKHAAPTRSSASPVRLQWIVDLSLFGRRHVAVRLSKLMQLLHLGGLGHQVGRESFKFMGGRLVRADPGQPDTTLGLFSEVGFIKPNGCCC